MTDDLYALTDLLRQQQRMIATAESCTGGLVAKWLTDQAGSSVWFERGFVTYSNASKRDLLGVSETVLQEWGEVSAEVVREMALGALANSQADCALAISGIAGPDGGALDKPVGTVWFAWALRGGGVTERMHRFAGDRDAVRTQAARFALHGMRELLSTGG